MLKNIQYCFGDSGDEGDKNLECLESLTVDWALGLITCYPKVMTPEVMESFVHLWQQTNKCNLNLISILSSTNLENFSRSQNPSLTWNKLEHFLNRLLKAGIIVPMILEDQCLELLREEWPEVCMFK